MSDGTPVGSVDRIAALDVLRGFALCGILVPNIGSFAMIEEAYSFPTANSDPGSLNVAIWAWVYLFFNEKFMTLFSMLFGVGLVIFAERAEARGAPVIGLSMTRMSLLILMGIAHAYLIWYGDILFVYGLCGIAVLFLRRLRPGKLFLLACASLAVPYVFDVLDQSTYAAPALPGSEEPDLIWEGELPSFEELMQEDWEPIEPESFGWYHQMEIEAYRSGWLEQMEFRVPTAFYMQTTLTPFWSFWRVCGVMMLGVVLLRSGFFTGGWSIGRLLTVTLVATPLGWLATASGLLYVAASDWSYRAFLFPLDPVNYVASLFVAWGYAAAVVLAVQVGALGLLTRALAPLGQMALTNYLTHSVVGTLIFYGHGLGLFEKVDRLGQLAIVVGILSLQVLFSRWWLSRFRFGPMEWLWRCGTYWRWQPLRRRPEAVVSPEATVH